jgi:hypothetical protein
LGNPFQTESAAAEPQGGKTASAKPKPPKLNPEQRRMLADIEKGLITKLNSKDNPGDRNTWYVIVEFDQAGALATSTTGSVNPLSGVVRARTTAQAQAQTHRRALPVQGRKAAAMAIMEYLYAPNKAAEKLQAPGIQGPNVEVNVAGTKQWEFRAFKTEEEARAYAQSVMAQDEEDDE